MVKLETAVALCKDIQKFLTEHPEYNANVALTGGTLYKEGERKDIDILLYPHKDDKEFDAWKIVVQMARPENGVKGWLYRKNFGRVMKAEWNGISIDVLNPGAPGQY